MVANVALVRYTVPCDLFTIKLVTWCRIHMLIALSGIYARYSCTSLHQTKKYIFLVIRYTYVQRLFEKSSNRYRSIDRSISDPSLRYLNGHSQESGMMLERLLWKIILISQDRRTYSYVVAGARSPSHSRELKFTPLWIIATENVRLTRGAIIYHRIRHERRTSKGLLGNVRYRTDSPKC